MKKKKQEDRDLPGYPHYPADEDILKADNSERVPIDIENISRNANVNSTIDNAKNKLKTSSEPKEESESLIESESDLTPDDLRALGEEGLNMDMGDDEILRNRPYDSITGDSDLDIPGAELDDDDEDIGREDEENNFYSLGGDKD